MTCHNQLELGEELRIQRFRDAPVTELENNVNHYLFLFELIKDINLSRDIGTSNTTIFPSGYLIPLWFFGWFDCMSHAN